MNTTPATYHRLAKGFGLLLTLMGTTLVLVFVTHLLTGANPFAGAPVPLDGPGLLILSSIGAFALPLGVSLFAVDGATSARMRIAAGALGMMALIRITGFANANIREAVGIAPLIEFFVLGGLASIAFFVRPNDESPIELRLVLEVEAPAARAWQALGEEFGSIGDWATGLVASRLDREEVEVGAIRTCEIEGFGPFPAGQITEEMVAFDREAMRFTYVATRGMPRMFVRAHNRWSIEAIDSHRCRVRSHASIDLRWWALPLAPVLGASIRSNVGQFGADLRRQVERAAEDNAGRGATRP